MAAFLPLKAGSWAYGEILTSAQMNQLNADFPFALNCRDGGTYTPSGHIILSTPTGQHVMFNGSHFPSATDGGGLNVAGANGLNAAYADIAGDADIGGDVSIIGDLDVPSGTATFDEIDGTPRLTGLLVPFGTGRVLPRCLNTTSDADLAFGTGSYEFVTIQDGFRTADHDFTIVDDGSQNESIDFEMLENVWTVTVKHPVSLATLIVLKNASGFANWARIRKISSGPSVFAVVAKYVVP